MIALALMLAQATPKAGTGINVYGAGKMSCATAFLPEHVAETRAWIPGYWSGFSMGLVRNAGNTDDEGIIGEVKLVCAQKPSITLTLAVIEARVNARAR